MSLLYCIISALCHTVNGEPLDPTMLLCRYISPNPLSSFSSFPLPPPPPSPPIPPGGVAANKSVIMHMLSQVRLGMDLTKIVLPTFILEKRSLLQMYAEFFSHPDLFAR